VKPNEKNGHPYRRETTALPAYASSVTEAREAPTFEARVQLLGGMQFDHPYADNLEEGVNGKGVDMLILGLILFLLGILLGINIFFVLGIVLMVVGGVLLAVGAGGSAVGGRRYWW
jgi:hypothetical protein